MLGLAGGLHNDLLHSKVRPVEQRVCHCQQLKGMFAGIDAERYLHDTMREIEHPGCLKIMNEIEAVVYLFYVLLYPVVEAIAAVPPDV